MYGLVNLALSEMVTCSHGSEAWERICKRAGVDTELFITSEGYPDEMTYSLVGAASEVLNQPLGDILQEFGVHWVLKTAARDYGDMMSAGGHNLRDFLQNLPQFHTRVGLILPHLQPPTFAYSDVEDRSICLHYHSHRAGLAPFMLGLLKGLGILFETPVQVEHLRSRTGGADHDEFVVRW